MRTTLFQMLLGFGLAFASTVQAQEASLFNGQDFTGWTFDPKKDGSELDIDDVWLVQDGMLICKGSFFGVLRHADQHEADYVLSLEWRWPPNIASGGAINLHSLEGKSDYGQRKMVEVSLSADQAGGIHYRGLPFGSNSTRERQRNREQENEMGEWNQLEIICRGKTMSVVVNGLPVNHVTDLPHSKGSIGLQCTPTPIFFRDIKVEKTLTQDHLEMQQVAEGMAGVWEREEAERKLEEAAKRQVELVEQQREKEKEEQLAAQQLSLMDALRAAVKLDPPTDVAVKLDAKSLPYPKDARELKFKAVFGMIDFKSGSSLNSLAAFYLREMAKRGWIEDESEAALEDDSVELTFKSGDAKFELELDQSSDYVRVSIDTDGVDFAGTNDPGSLMAIGIPQPRKALLLQKEVPIPPDVQKLEFDDDGCMFLSSMKLAEAFAHFGNLIRQKGYRESRRPILNDTRNYTEFQRGQVELSVNIFTHEVGTRIVLEYEDGQEDPVVPPLAEVAIAKPGERSLPGSPPILGSPASAAVDSTARDGSRVDVSRNKGTATIRFGEEEHVFQHVAAFRTKFDLENRKESTSLVFSRSPIPFTKMQGMLATEDHLSFSELYTFDPPHFLTVDVGESPYFSCSMSGASISQGMKESSNEMKVEAGRIRGTLTLVPIEVFDREFSFSVAADAAIMTPSTRVAEGAASISLALQGEFVDQAPPMPSEAEEFSRSGTNYAKTYKANVRMSLGETAEFFRTTLLASNWRELEAPTPSSPASEENLRFQVTRGTMTIRLKRAGPRTEIAVTKHDVEMARQHGVLPEPGKGRLILANAHNVPVAFTIGTTDYRLEPGRGSDDFKDALNYSVGPGKYTVIIKIPGQRPQTETLNIAVGASWALIALPTGGYAPIPLY